MRTATVLPLEPVRHTLAEWLGTGSVSYRPWSGTTGADLFISRVVRQALHEDSRVDAWIEEQRLSPGIEASVVPLPEMEGWRLDPGTGNLVHASGRFFSITGVAVRHRGPHGEISWDQPAIDQPEVGILGILAAPIEGVLHFCLQAKEEPGNIGPLQLSPTVQATYSNYTRAHGGAPIPLLEHFIDPPPERLLFARLQTEDGGRFLFKSNRNMIVLLDEPPPLPGRNFIWLTLRQIARLMTRDNLVHACTRSVLSVLVCGGAFSRVMEQVPISGTGLDFGELARFASGELRHAGKPIQVQDALQWLDHSRAAVHLHVKREPMASLAEWSLEPDGAIRHRENRFFSILGLSVRGAGREVVSWSQPIIAPSGTGTIGLLTQVRGGRRFFLMQAKADVGNRNMVQIGPTVQFTPMNYLGNRKLPMPFLFDEFTASGRWRELRDSRQAEEGARFYLEQHRHCVLELPEGEPLDIPPGFRWFSGEELCFFLGLGENVNSCARSILACLL